MKSTIKQWAINITGYWMYKKKHLPTGVDLMVDIQNHFPQDKFQVIFDVGANIGQTALEFSKAFKQVAIYSFEPSKPEFEKLKKNTSHLKEVTSFNSGMGSKQGKMNLYHGKYSAWNSLVPDLNDTGVVSEVAVSTVDHFMDENNIAYIDLLKTDTEGFDMEVLKGAEKALVGKKVKFIFTEAGFYDANKRNTSFNELKTYLDSCGYTLFSIYGIAKGASEMVNGNALFVLNK